MTTPISENPAVALRRDLIDGNFELDAETVTFMKVARTELARSARAIVDAAPSTADVGRVIAFLDKMQDAKDTVCAAAIIGDESSKRADKKRKACATTGKVS